MNVSQLVSGSVVIKVECALHFTLDQSIKMPLHLKTCQYTQPATPSSITTSRTTEAGLSCWALSCQKDQPVETVLETSASFHGCLVPKSTVSPSVCGRLRLVCFVGKVKGRSGKGCKVLWGRKGVESKGLSGPLIRELLFLCCSTWQNLISSSTVVSEEKHKKKGEECQKEALTFDEFNTLVEMIKTQNKTR